MRAAKKCISSQRALIAPILVTLMMEDFGSSEEMYFFAACIGC
jgi:hypothetical protein